MKKTAVILALMLSVQLSFAYNDHRGFNLDSLERAVAVWTPQAIDKASEQELLALNRSYRDLMIGWLNLNAEKTKFYGKKALAISVSQGWQEASNDAYRYVGLSFYGQEQYDSALVYFLRSVECVDKMAAGATSPNNPNGYTEKEVDDCYAALYGTIGNLYNVMDNIPEAMNYYLKAGELFDKYGWNESNTVLWYNIGETWMDEGDLDKARDAYDKAVHYAAASGDSLMMIYSYKGLGRLYMEKKQAAKALKYLREVNAYYAVHPEEGDVFPRETLEFIDSVLTRQKKQLSLMLAGSILVILLLAGLLFVVLKLRKTKQEKAEASALIEEVLEEIPPQREDVKLSPREQDILDLLSKGYTAPDIGKALGLSHETIRWYRKKLIAKFDVSNTAELISIAKEMGLI
ncbi:MAG: LuxR family transcriptional regulator [Bacteroidales bacterium]|nr:LuxR family transcriptional regulator [Bacteroidales bacterium]